MRATVDIEYGNGQLVFAQRVIGSPAWHLLPGMRDGIVDAAKLEACVAEVRRQAAEAGRIRPCDACVGKILVRGLLEIGSRSVNFATFLFYSRIFRVPKWALIQQS
jgi:hypothetical protein